MKEFKLTEGQRGFAADNHEVLMRFLEDKKLSVDEFYDVVVFGYLYAVMLDAPRWRNKSLHLRCFFMKIYRKTLLFDFIEEESKNKRCC